MTTRMLEQITWHGHKLNCEHLVKATTNVDETQRATINSVQNYHMSCHEQLVSHAIQMQCFSAITIVHGVKAS